MPPVHLLWFAGKEEGRVGCDGNRQGEGMKQTACLSSLLAAGVCLAPAMEPYSSAPAMQHQSHGNETAFSQEKDASTDGRIIEVFYHQAT